MRKIYNLLLLAVMFIAGTAAVQAQSKNRYSVDDWQTTLTADELVPGVKFVMEGAESGSGSVYDFIAGLSKTTNLSDDNFYELEAAGGTEEGLATFRLKRVSTGEYLENKDGAMSYSSSVARAWKFVIKDAVTVSNEELNPAEGETSPLTDFSNVTLDGTADVNRVIFCDAAGNSAEKNGTVFFITGNKGAAPSFSASNYNKNVIAAYAVNGEGVTQMLGASYIEQMLGELGLSEGVEDKYIAGDQPGQTPEQYVTAVKEAYDKCQELYNAMSEDHEACVAALEALEKAMKEADANFIYVKEGFYYFSSGRSETNGVFDEDHKMTWTYNWDPAWTVPTADPARAMTIDDVKFVWQIIADKDNKGAYYLQNYYTKGYIGLADNGVGAKVKTIDTPTESFLIYPVGKRGGEVTWSIESTTLKKKPLKGWDGKLDVTALHCAGDHDGVCIWEPGNNDGSGWRFYNVNMDELNAFDAQIEQNKRNEKLTSLVNEAQATYDAAAFCLDFNGNKNGKLDQNEDGTPMGLLTAEDQLSSNSIETSEGNQLAGLVDGSIASGNFFHSIWNQAAADEQGFNVAEAYPNIAMDLRKAVKEVVIKMWPRRNGNNLLTNNLPGKVSIQASNDGQEWTQIDTINTTLAYTYVGEDEFVSNGNAVGILRVKLPEAYQWIRMEVCTRYGSKVDFKANANLGSSCYNMGEMRVFECWDTPALALNSAVDAAILKAFEDALAAAKAELEAESATQATIDDFTKKYEAYKNDIPDPSLVTVAIAEAKAQLEGAEEGEDYGYFAAGSKDEFTTKLAAIEGQVKDVMSKSEIQALKNQVTEALAAFNGKLILPADGAYVRVQSTSSEAPNGSFLRTAGNGAERNRWSTLDGDENLMAKLDYVWKFIKNADNTYSLQNVLNGQYLNVPKANNSGAGMSADADTCHFTIRTAKVGGSVNFVFNDNVYMNAQPNGKNPSGAVVTWNSASGADNSAWTFQDADVASEWEGSIVKDVVANGAYVFTLPVAVKAAAGCYEVLGFNKEGKTIELKEIEGNIEAGTPFVFVEQDGATSVFFEAVETDATALTYATEAKTVNGLVGTLAPGKAPVGYGILYGTEGTVVDATAADNVATNSGYFAPTMSETTEKGAHSLSVDGKIDAIQNAVVAADAEVVNVYTLTGVQVRANVKAENAAKNLPAGLYIIGSKKVLVK